MQGFRHRVGETVAHIEREGFAADEAGRRRVGEAAIRIQDQRTAVITGVESADGQRVAIRIAVIGEDAVGGIHRQGPAGLDGIAIVLDGRRTVGDADAEGLRDRRGDAVADLHREGFAADEAAHRGVGEAAIGVPDQRTAVVASADGGDGERIAIGIRIVGEQSLGRTHCQGTGMADAVAVIHHARSVVLVLRTDGRGGDTAAAHHHLFRLGRGGLPAGGRDDPQSVTGRTQIGEAEAAIRIAGHADFTGIQHAIGVVVQIDGPAGQAGLAAVLDAVTVGVGEQRAADAALGGHADIDPGRHATAGMGQSCRCGQIPATGQHGADGELAGADASESELA